MRRILHDETGATIIIVAFAMTILMTFAALTIDIGYAYIQASSAQNCADATALSLSGLLPVKEGDNGRKSQIISRAQEYGKKNGVTDITENDVKLEDYKDGYYYSASVYVHKTCETQLARVIGVYNIKQTKKAKVSAIPSGGILGAVPIGVTEEVFNETKDSNESVTLKFGGGDGTNGFYGYIVLDGAKGNAFILEQWLKYGYPGENYVGQVLPTASGNKASVAKDAVDYRMSLCTHFKLQGGCTSEHYVPSCPRIIDVLIYDVIDSKTVKIVGFAPFILEYSDDFDEIRGTYLKMPVQQATDRVGNKDFGGYIGKLTE